VSSWPWLCVSSIYNYLCNLCLSPLMLWVRISISARWTTLCNTNFQWLETGRRFSPVSSTNKTERHNITEILLKVAYIYIEINTLSFPYWGLSLPWSYGSGITYAISAYHHWYYEFESRSGRGRCTTLCDKVCQWLTTGRWFSQGPPVSSTIKTDRHEITEILLKVALKTIKQTNIFHISPGSHTSQRHNRGVIAEMIWNSSCINLLSHTSYHCFTSQINKWNN